MVQWINLDWNNKYVIVHRYPHRDKNRAYSPTTSESYGRLVDEIIMGGFKKFKAICLLCSISVQLYYIVSNAFSVGFPINF